MRTDYHVLLKKVWKFVKELVILFHRISAAPWGHVVSTRKRAPTEDSSSFSTPTAVSDRSIRSSPWRQTYLVPSTSQEPRATNACAELKGTKTTAKFQQGILSAKLHLTPYNLTLQQPYLTLLLYTYHLSEHWTLFWTLTYSLFFPFGVKPCLVFVIYKFCYTKSRSSPFFKSCHPSPYCCWSTVYSF